MLTLVEIIHFVLHRRSSLEKWRGSLTRVKRRVINVSDRGGEGTIYFEHKLAVADPVKGAPVWIKVYRLVVSRDIVENCSC